MAPEAIDDRGISPKIGESFPDVRLPDQSGRRTEAGQKKKMER